MVMTDQAQGQAEHSLVISGITVLDLSDCKHGEIRFS
jgi:hypothetical protein